MRENN
jgi:hypothetical protein